MPPRAILAAMIVALCWGGNYTASKFALADFPPFLLLMLRFLGCSIFLLPFVIGKPLPRMREMALLSLMLIVIQFAFVFTALHMGVSITTSIIATQLGVPFSCVMAAILFKDFLGPWRSFGLMIAFVGVMIVAGTPNAAEHWVGFLLTVLGAFSWSGANMYLKTIKPIPTTAMLFWTALLAVPPFALLSLIAEDNQWLIIQSAHASAWAGIAYGIVFASFVGYGLWSWLVKSYPMSVVMPFGLLMPVAGITIGSLVFHEPLTPQIIVGGLLAIAGVGIISLRRPKLAELER